MTNVGAPLVGAQFLERVKMFENVFADNFGFYYFQADYFAHAAERLEQIAKIGDSAWDEEMRKEQESSGVPKYGVRPFKPTYEIYLAEKDRKCRNISIYLCAHSLELLLKGLYIEKFNMPKKDSHRISVLYKNVKDLLEPHNFYQNKLDNLFLWLDEVLVWAGRYPTPIKREKKPEAYEDSLKQFATTPLGITNDIATALRVNFGTLLTDFRNHVAGIISKSISERQPKVNA